MPPSEPWPLPARIACAALLAGAAAGYMKAPGWAGSGLGAVATGFFAWAGFMRHSAEDRAPRLSLRMGFLGLAAFGAAGAVMQAGAPRWTFFALGALAVLLFLCAVAIRALRRAEPGEAASP